MVKPSNVMILIVPVGFVRYSQNIASHNYFRDFGHYACLMISINGAKQWFELKRVLAAVNAFFFMVPNKV